MGKRNNYFIFIVEGSHDKWELSAIINSPHFKNTIGYDQNVYAKFFYQYKGDMTSDYKWPIFYKMVSTYAPEFWKSCSNKTKDEIFSEIVVRKNDNFYQEWYRNRKNNTAAINKWMIEFKNHVFNILEKSIKFALNRGDDRNKNNYKTIIDPNDVVSIIHLIDTDGAFIKDKNIKISNDKKFSYAEDKIITQNKFSICLRNWWKKQFVEILISMGKLAVDIKKYYFLNLLKNKYRVYFVSCNMDHYLTSKYNTSIEEKSTNENIFCIKCKEYGFLLKSKYSTLIQHTSKDSWIQTWDYIKKGTNSLKRNSNLNQFFGKYFKK